MSISAVQICNPKKKAPKNLSIQKNQLEIEKSELEQKYKILTDEHESLMKKLEEIQNKEKKAEEIEKFNSNCMKIFFKTKYPATASKSTKIQDTIHLGIRTNN